MMSCGNRIESGSAWLTEEMWRNEVSTPGSALEVTAST
jgi:hypothetical protein